MATDAGKSRTGSDTNGAVAASPPGHEVAAGAPPVTDDAGAPADVRRVVQSALDAVAKAGAVSAVAVVDALESAARSLSRRIVADALAATGERPALAATGERPAVADRASLARALAEKPATPPLATATAAAVALRVASRFRHLGFLARRGPMWLLATAVPAMMAAVSQGAHELGLVASHLAQRAEAAGAEPDPERVRRAAVQILSRRPVDPEVEPSHGALAFSWLRRSVRAALPFTSGVATADPEGLAAAAADVDPALLGPS
jgi:hypothetical protein